MVELHFYLDRRSVADGSPAPLKLVFGKRGQSAQLKTGIKLLPSEWDAHAQRIINHPYRRNLNSDLARIRSEIEDYLRPMIFNGSLADKTATEIKRMVDEHLNGGGKTILLKPIYDAYMQKKSKGSQTVYSDTWKSVLAYDADAEKKPISRFNKEWAQGYVASLANYSPNTIATRVRCIKAVFNSAITDNIIKNNPMKGYSSKAYESRSRDLTRDQLHALLNAETQTESERLALDFFALSFYLRAINPADLRNLAPDDYYNGRIYYDRQKTGKPYSVKVEPEAEAIIEKYRTATRLAPPAKGVNEQLKAIAKRNGLPPISMYWARHTLASLLFELGYGVDLVGAILGHSNGMQVTMRYVDIKEKQKDDAIRALLEYIK